MWRQAEKTVRFCLLNLRCDYFNMKKKKSPLVKLTKESPKARKERVSSGIKFRAAVFEDKKKKAQDKGIPYEVDADE